MTLTCTMYLGDCLEVMPTLPKGSAHMSYSDLPYATKGRPCTALSWDNVFDTSSLWSAFSSCLSDRYSSVFSANIHLAAHLLSTNRMNFRHDLVWKKQLPTGFLQSAISPLRTHEHVLVFGAAGMVFNPQKKQGTRKRTDTTGGLAGGCYRTAKTSVRASTDGMLFPGTIITADWEKTRFSGTIRSHHPTQKPIALLDWLIRTYSNSGDHVLDPVSGSATTAVSALQNGRHVTCIEKDPTYFEAGVERVRKHIADNHIDTKVEVRR